MNRSAPARCWRAGRERLEVSVANLRTLGEQAGLDRRRQEPAADEVEDHVFPDGADDHFAIGEEVQRVGIAVGEFDIRLQFLEVGDDRIEYVLGPGLRLVRGQRIIVEPRLAVLRGHRQDGGLEEAAARAAFGRVGDGDLLRIGLGKGEELGEGLCSLPTVRPGSSRVPSGCDGMAPRRRHGRSRAIPVAAFSARSGALGSMVLSGRLAMMPASLATRTWPFGIQKMSTGESWPAFLAAISCCTACSPSTW